MAPRTGRIAHGLLLAAFACRALVPAGFMPAALDAGGPIVVCPGGSAGAVFRLIAERSAAAHAGHRQHEHAPDDFDAWEFCPVGASLLTAIPTAAVDFQLPVLRHVLDPIEPEWIPQQIVGSAYRARAPPST
jgi:hypothetical protein